jgi:hypothetical protein
MHRRSSSSRDTDPSAAKNWIGSFGAALSEASQEQCHGGGRVGRCRKADKLPIEGSVTASSCRHQRDSSTDRLIRCAINVVNGTHEDKRRAGRDRAPTCPKRLDTFCGLHFDNAIELSNGQHYVPTKYEVEHVTEENERTKEMPKPSVSSLEDFAFTKMEFSIVDFFPEAETDEAQLQEARSSDQGTKCVDGAGRRMSLPRDAEQSTQSRHRSRSRAGRSPSRQRVRSATGCTGQKRGCSKGRQPIDNTCNMRSSSLLRGPRNTDQRAHSRDMSQSRDRSRTREDKELNRSHSRGRRSKSRSRGVPSGGGRDPMRHRSAVGDETIDERLKQLIIEAESTFRTRNLEDGGSESKKTTPFDGSQLHEQSSRIVQTSGENVPLPPSTGMTPPPSSPSIRRRSALARRIADRKSGKNDHGNTTGPVCTPVLSSRRKKPVESPLASEYSDEQKLGEESSSISRTRRTSLSRRRISKRDVMHNNDNKLGDSGHASAGAAELRRLKRLQVQNTTESPTITVKSAPDSGSSRAAQSERSKIRMLNSRSNSCNGIGTSQSRIPSGKATTTPGTLPHQYADSSISEHIVNVSSGRGDEAPAFGLTRLVLPSRHREPDRRLDSLLLKLRDPSSRNLLRCDDQ